MEVHLKPARLDADPTSPVAEKEYHHWKTTMQNFITTLKITDEGEKYKLLINFLSPTVFTYVSDVQTYTLAIQSLDNVYNKPKNIWYARHVLLHTKQLPNQSLDDFLCTLKNLSQDCSYKAVTAEEHRNQSMLSAFIGGLSSSFIQQRLLESGCENLSLNQAVTQARTLESSVRDAEGFRNNSFIQPQNCAVSNFQPSEGNSINALKSGVYGAKNKSKCWFCGGPRHPRLNCPAREDKCGSCGRIGHWAKLCNNKSSNSAAMLVSSSSSENSAMFSSNSGFQMPRLTALTQEYSKTVLEKVEVNGKSTVALLDSGARGANFMDEKFAAINNIPYMSTQYSIGLASTSKSCKVVGVTNVNLKLQNRCYNKIQMSIVKDLVCDIILGDEFMKKHSSVEFRFGGNDPPLVLSGLSSMDMALPPMFSHLPAHITPIATKSRRFSTIDKTFIAEEVQRLLQKGVIEPSRSPWRAQVLVDRNEGKKPRMVIDYSKTINTYTIPDSYPIPRIDEMVNKLAENEVFSTFDLVSAYHQVKLPQSDWEFTAFEAAGKLYHFKRLPFGLTNAVAAFQRLMDEIVEKHQLKGVFVYMDNITVAGRTQVEHDENVKKFLEAAAERNLSFNEGKTVRNTKSVKLLGYQISFHRLEPDPDRVKTLLNLPVPNSIPSLKRAIGLFAYYAKWVRNYSDTIRPLLLSDSVPLKMDAIQSFKTLKAELAKAALQNIDEDLPFTIETDASNHCLSATLNQCGRPVAFHSRTLSGSELLQSAVEKEAAAIVDAVRTWNHLLANKHFTLVTDQRSVAFMFNKSHSNSVKNNKIQRWRMELAPLNYTIVFRSGCENKAADALSRPMCGAIDDNSLYDIHDSIGHPGITRTLHFIRSRNLPYSVEDVKRVISKCKICQEIKPQFFKPQNQTLIEATRPFQRLNLDFKGPIPSSTPNKFFLTAIDEYSRYPFAFPCSDMTSTTVIQCLTQIFALFGQPDYIHSDRGSNFLSTEVKSFLNSKGIASSKTTPYNPRGNGQTERYNGVLWNTILLMLKSHNLPVSKWECVVTDALHSVRSLLCTATNCTPHERIFSYNRKTTSGTCLPNWLTTPGGTILVKRHDRISKYQSPVQKAELIHCNPQYAEIRLADGRETTVSLRDVAPYSHEVKEPVSNIPVPNENIVEVNNEEVIVEEPDTVPVDNTIVVPELRRSSRPIPPPIDRLGYS